LEHLQLNAPDLMALLFPRTSTNRRGINLSLSGIIDTGYHGNLIFPMKNEAGDQVLRLYPGERICQVIFETLDQPLSMEAARLHGMAPAKYSHAEDSTYRVDKSEERERLVAGDLDGLKSTFGLDLDKDAS
jgi:dCTP deaminase